MKRPPLSSLLSLIVFHAAAACSVDAAPSTEEILSTRPKDLIRLLEVKGMIDSKEQAKFEAAKRWCRAVNNWGKMGT